MVTGLKKRKAAGSKKRFIGKPNGQIQERVQAAGPESFGIVAVDCAKRRSKWMLCNFYGKVLIEPTMVEHTTGGLRVMTQLVAAACKSGQKVHYATITSLLSNANTPPAVATQT